jgi:hypothetical protein
VSTVHPEKGDGRGKAKSFISIDQRVVVDDRVQERRYFFLERAIGIRLGCCSRG